MIAPPDRSAFQPKGKYTGGTPVGLRNPYSITLGDPYGLANTVADTFNATIKALIKTKLDAQIVAETDAIKKAALQAKLDESQSKRYMARLQSVWRSPRHNMEEGGLQRVIT